MWECKGIKISRKLRLSTYVTYYCELYKYPVLFFGSYVACTLPHERQIVV